MNILSKPSFGFPAILALLVLFFAGCSDPQPLKVGFVGELSGRRSEIGVSVRNAVQFRVDQINEAGGVNGRLLELVIKDNAGDPAKSQQIIETLIAEGRQFIIGPLLSQQAVAAEAAIKDKDVLLLTPTMSTDYLTGKDDNLLRSCSTTSKQGVQLAEYSGKVGLKTITVVYDLSNQKYTELLYKAYREEAKKLGVETTLVLTIHKTKHPEMLPLAEQIAKVNTDGVLMCLSAVDAANLAQQLRKIGSKAQFLGVSWSQTADLLPHGGRAVEGMVLITTHRYGKPNPVKKTFEKEYVARYNKEPSFVSSKGYDVVTLLQRGLESAESVTPAAVKAAILKDEGFQGAEKWIELDEFGDILVGYNLVTVKDGQYVHVE